MMEHQPGCPRSQFWDAGEYEAPCTCDEEGGDASDRRRRSSTIDTDGDRTSPPKRIWLQWPELGDANEGGWCEEQIDDSDVEYVRVDKASGADQKKLEDHYRQRARDLYCGVIHVQYHAHKHTSGVCRVSRSAVACAGPEDIAIDSDARVLPASADLQVQDTKQGAWVQAWVYVPPEDSDGGRSR